MPIHFGSQIWENPTLLCVLIHTAYLKKQKNDLLDDFLGKPVGRQQATLDNFKVSLPPKWGQTEFPLINIKASSYLTF